MAALFVFDCLARLFFAPQPGRASSAPRRAPASAGLFYVSLNVLNSGARHGSQNDRPGTRVSIGRSQGKFQTSRKSAKRSIVKDIRGIRLKAPF
jgi:hypothetical protein